MKKIITATVTRPTLSGESTTENLFTTGIFTGAKVKIDPLFQEVLNTLDGEYFDASRDYAVFQTNEETNSYIDEIVLNFGCQINCVHEATANILRANLQYLSNEGANLLAIAEGEDETNFILDYIKVGDGEDSTIYVLYVEHEYENGEREVHLHARKVRTWGNDTPAGFFQRSGTLLT